MTVIVQDDHFGIMFAKFIHLCSNCVCDKPVEKSNGLKRCLTGHLKSCLKHFTILKALSVEKAKTKLVTHSHVADEVAET